MREIKFNIWDNKRKEWVHKGINLLGEVIIMGDILTRESDDTGVTIDELGDLVVCQYTGLKDKNGKEVYEGDILAIPRNAPDHKMVNHCGVLFGEFCGGGPDEDVHTVGFYSGDRDYAEGLGNKLSYGYEVVGNIYENSDLLVPTVELV